MLRLRLVLAILLIFTGLFVGIIVYGVNTAQTSSQPLPPSLEAVVKLTLAPESALPDFAKKASPQVQKAYRFAIANPDVLRKFPCYCGCGAIGHRHNLDCYIKEFKPDGSIVFENHAFG
jgi:hypothetical protein